MTFKKLIIFTTSFLFTSGVLAAPVAKERWFEVEVILFSQLGDKSILKEAFPAAEDVTPMPKYKRVIDLLAPYIQPDLSPLKQLLPGCDSPEYPNSLFIQASQPAPLFIEKSLAEIEQLQIEHLGADIEQPTTKATFEVQNTSPINSATIDENTRFSESESVAIVDNIEAPLTTQNSNLTTGFDQAFVSSLTLKQIALVAEAEQTFSPIQFLAKQNLIEQGLTQNRQQGLCRLPESYFSETSQQAGDFNYNGFPVKSMPTTISNTENLYSKKPYLLNKESLQLHDIVKQLKLSKNFRPLLHLGWRHAPVDKKYAEAYRVYGGDHLNEHYQQAQKDYQDVVDEALLLEQQVFEQDTAADGSFQRDNIDEARINANQFDESQLDENQLNTKITEKISEIIAQAPSIDESKIAEINAALDNPEQLLNFLPNNKQLNVANPPIAPLQPWQLDGLFRVHLNHYLYITADFSIINTTLTQQATHALKSAEPLDIKPIRFQQNKRVISGEIHYFDHPYMGMIVQIRKHKRPQLEPEL